MKITFLGAAQTVTGSCTLLESDGLKFLVDCGLFQGQEFATDENAKPFPFNPADIKFVLLTHAHADHCGRLPKLYKDGFRGKVYCTDPTKDLAEITYLDSARLIMREAAQLGKEPIFTELDIAGLLNHFQTFNYYKKFEPAENVSVMFKNAGHILGSSLIEISFTENDQTKTIVFSGDLGNSPAPLVKDPDTFSGADFVVCESTYGGRIHEPPEWRGKILQEAIEESIVQGGTLLIPVFSLERTQEILYELNTLVENRHIEYVKMFLDSPLAIRAVDIYQKYRDWFDEEAQKRLKSGDDLFQFRGLRYTLEVEDSKKINKTDPPKVIMAGSGMCNGGRILHHLKLYLPEEQNSLLIVSFQAEGTLGRQIKDGAEKIQINGEEVVVRAKVKAVGGFSSHADQPRLLHWLKNFQEPKPQLVFINHGEEKENLMLQDGVQEKLGLKTQIAKLNATHEI